MGYIIGFPVKKQTENYHGKYSGNVGTFLNLHL